MSTEFNLGNDYVNVKASSIITLHENFTVFTQEGPVDLNVEIKADFADIPQKYQEVFMNVLTAKYINKVSYGDNPFSQCRPIKKRKWWQIWKQKFIES
jgi:hypothetical protein